MDALHCLHRYPLFALLGSKLEAWVRAAESASYALGETIFQEGTLGNWAFLILEGKVRAFRVSRDKQEKTLSQFGPEELFGDYALLAPHLYPVSCRATAPTRVLRLPLLPLRRVFAAEPRVHHNLKNWLRLNTLASYLRGRTFLGFLSAPSGLAFLDKLQPVRVPPGYAVQAEGLADDAWFFIEKGRATLADARADAPPRELSAGDAFGEQALLGRKLPTVTVLEDLQCLSLARTDFDPATDLPSRISLQSYQAATWVQRMAHGFVGQAEAADCGLAALAMAARVLNKEFSLHELRQRVPIGQHGLNLLELQSAAAGLGLRAQAVRIRPEQLEHVALPAIAHQEGGHYVVVFERGLDGCWIVGDPASSIQRLTPEAFAKSWTGNLLLVSK